MNSSLSSLASEVTIWTKRVSRDLLNDVGREAFKTCLGEYASAKWEASEKIECFAEA